MATAPEIITALGGTSNVARELELPPSTVSSWKTGAGIPKWRMPGIQALAERLGIDLEDIHSPANTAPAKSASCGKSGDVAAQERAA